MNELCFQERLSNAFHTYIDNIAIRCGAREITYRELDLRSGCILNYLLENKIPRETFIGIYIEDKIDLISAMIGIIKAGCVFVPLDTKFPVKRIENMVRMTNTAIIFSDEDNRERLYRDGGDIPKNIRIIPVSDSLCDSHGPGAAVGSVVQYGREDKIYIYFTSGSTGTPNAVVGKNKSLLHFIDWEISTFSIDETYRFSQLNSPAFDAFLRDVFVPLGAGATICIPDGSVEKMALDNHQLADWIDGNQIHLIHCLPSLFRVFNSNGVGGRNFKHLKYILLAGERLNISDLKKWYDKFDEKIQLVNLYGPTETTMVKTFYFIDKKNIPNEKVPIGKSMKGSRVLILDKQLNICPEKTAGEIYIRTPYGTFGYYNNPGLTNERFIPNPFTGDANDLFYKTGDLGRTLPDGNIEFIGRIDRQIKINGVRVEPGEIENALKTHPEIAEAVVTAPGDNEGEIYLCAYYVSRKAVNPTQLMEYLALVLPSYMIPTRFTRIEEIPLLPGGKIDFKALPASEHNRVETGGGIPGDEIERTLVKIWSNVLEIDESSIGVHDFFTDLDGQSLKAIMMASWIHKEFNVSIPIHAIFQLSTIKKLAGYIRNSNHDKFHAIEPAEKKEYYTLSPGQKRFYIITQMELANISYNVPQVIPLEGKLAIEKLEGAFNKLIDRHESLRTSFEMIAEEPVQRIHKIVKLNIEYYHPRKESGMPPGLVDTGEMIKNFIRPFNLETPPLLRVGLIVIDENKYILMADMHHIISDAASRKIFLEDFLDLYEAKEMPALRLQYRDYAEWINRPAQREVMKQQERYWLEQFGGEPPALHLPLDFPRPTVQSFEGGHVEMIIGKEETTALQKLAMYENATLFMVLLAIFNVFLAKITGREDISVGTPVVGRRHTDLQKIIGIFVNTLVLRNYPESKKTFSRFLGELRGRVFQAFENQQYQFEDLVNQLMPKRDAGRNPLFDVLFSYREVELHAEAISRMNVSMADRKLFQFEHIISRFDLSLSVVAGEELKIAFEYCSKLFKRETIEKIAIHFIDVVGQVLENKDIKIRDIGLTHQLLVPEENTGEDEESDWNI